MRPLHASIRPITGLSASERDRMFEVFAEYYASISFERFVADLSGKDDVIMLVDERQVIQGFSGMKNLAMTVHGKKVYGVFNGDTVVAKVHWGQRVLGKAFLRYLFVQRARRPFSPYYWFLISKGYKTYLLMANNFDDHVPRYEQPMGTWERAVLDAFASALYPREYDPETHLIRFEDSHGHLRPGVADITPELCRQHPRIAFFAAANPSWAEGTELACIARMTWSMPFKYALKARLRRSPKLKLEPTTAGAAHGVNLTIESGT